MDNEKTLSSLSRLMFVLNLAIIVFYSLLCLTTTLRRLQLPVLRQADPSAALADAFVGLGAVPAAVRRQLREKPLGH